MRQMVILPILALALAAIGPAAAGPGTPGHAHETFSAGEPGDPKKAQQVILVVMREGDGRIDRKSTRLNSSHRL